MDDDKVLPYRMQMNFTMGSNDPDRVSEIYDAIVEDALARGVFFEFGFDQMMDPEDVIPDSPLHVVITGVDPKGAPR